MMKTSLSHRLASLDVLRGFDLFLLVFFQPVIWALGQQVDRSWAKWLLYQFDHEVWAGFRFWDLVMPLFLFMSGVSLPFSLSGYVDGRLPKHHAYYKIFRRFVILFLLGMVVQGNLLGFDWAHIYFYTNTLQAIASGYLIAAMVLLHFGTKGQVIATVLLLLTYWGPMTFCGDFTVEGSFANRLDALVLGRFRGDPTYTWVWSSLTFGVTVLLGCFTGRIMREGHTNRPYVVRRLLWFGVALVLAGLLWSLQMPVIKRIWTASMALYSGGLCVLLMAAFYYWIDVRGHHRGLMWLKAYGMNSIVAYMLGEVVNFRSIVDSLSYGLAPHLGDFYSVWLTFGNFLILFFILRRMYFRQIFIKI